MKVTDTLEYKTPSGKKVYGGGGIMPDIFVPIDTTYDTDYLSNVLAAGLMSQFAYDYVDRNRTDLPKYKNANEFRKEFKASGLINDFISFAAGNGVKPDNAQIKRSSPLITLQLKAFIARLLWQNAGLFPIIHESDPAFIKALQFINS